MLKPIKSIFFKKMLFSLLNERRKLNIVIYNKSIKNYLDINLSNYKILSWRYIKYEEDGKGKEYDNYNDKLLFEGEYLKGERNGKGKEFFSINVMKRYIPNEDQRKYKIKFEGEFLKGKRNGKGKEYNLYGNIIFEGEYLNGERNGEGKEYYSNRKLKFEGEYLKGKKWNGKLYDFKSDKIYELENGTGSVIEYNDNSYEMFIGKLINGKREGKGIEYLINLYVYPIKKYKIFEGEYLNDQRNRGREYIDKRIYFEGEYKKGKKWNGKIYDSQNVSYELKEGKGFIKEYNYYNKYNDYGDFLVFEGEYLNGERNGKGKEFYYDGKLKFEGEYLNGERNGKWKEYNHNGELFFEGEYLYDM